MGVQGIMKTNLFNLLFRRRKAIINDLVEEVKLLKEELQKLKDKIHNKEEK